MSKNDSERRTAPLKRQPYHDIRRNPPRPQPPHQEVDKPICLRFTSQYGPDCPPLLLSPSSASGSALIITFSLSSISAVALRPNRSGSSFRLGALGRCIPLARPPTAGV
ncbi:hypothetical protein BDW68DRAFT_107412 [Aspergillus falconensis]